jgi:hypothetical protein
MSKPAVYRAGVLPRAKRVVLGLLMLVAPVEGSAAPTSESDGSFEATIVNDCPQAMKARFVAMASGSDEVTDEALKKAPLVRLKGRSRITRRMVANERLVIVKGSTTFEAWFKSKEEGRGGLLRIGADCRSIAEETRPRDPGSGSR